MKRIWLRDARLRANLTQAQLADIIGKPQNFISRLESGSEPLLADALAIAKALNLDIETLRFGKREVAA